MSKTKFVLTEDLIKVEPEIFTSKKKIIEDFQGEKERISLNINSLIKKDLHLYCVHNKRRMTDVIELAVKEYLKKNCL